MGDVTARRGIGGSRVLQRQDTRHCSTAWPHFARDIVAVTRHWLFEAHHLRPRSAESARGGGAWKPRVSCRGPFDDPPGDLKGMLPINPAGHSSGRLLRGTRQRWLSSDVINCMYKDSCAPARTSSTSLAEIMISSRDRPIEGVWPHRLGPIPSCDALPHVRSDGERRADRADESESSPTS